MALQCKRKRGSPTPDQFAQLFSGQPFIDMDNGELYIGECYDGRPINASNLLNARNSSNNPNGGLFQYVGNITSPTGTPSQGRVGNTATGTFAISFGQYVHSDANNSITLGYTSVNKSTYGTVIGRGNYSEGDDSVIIGKGNTNKGADNYIIGSFNNINGVNGCYLIGTGLTATTRDAFIIGTKNDNSHNGGQDIFQIGDGWGDVGTDTGKFNLVTVSKRVTDDGGQYVSGGYMEVAIQGNTEDSVIKKSTMDAAINRIKDGTVVVKNAEHADNATKVNNIEINTTEQWTFTLEDGTTVTKKVVLA